MIYQPDGTPMGRFGTDELTEPVSLTFDGDGRLLVTDEAADLLYVYDVVSS